jgi:hypothetical protein
MNNLETLETAEVCSAPVSNVITLPVRQAEERPQPWSLSVWLRNVMKRFVTWIDRVDVDGQQHWN